MFERRRFPGLDNAAGAPVPQAPPPPMPMRPAGWLAGAWRQRMMPRPMPGPFQPPIQAQAQPMPTAPAQAQEAPLATAAPTSPAQQAAVGGDQSSKALAAAAAGQQIAAQPVNPSAAAPDTSPPPLVQQAAQLPAAQAAAAGMGGLATPPVTMANIPTDPQAAMAALAALSPGWNNQTPQQQQEALAYANARDAAIGATMPNGQPLLGAVSDPAAAGLAFMNSGYTGAQALADGWGTGTGRAGWYAPAPAAPAAPIAPPPALPPPPAASDVPAQAGSGGSYLPPAPTTPPQRPADDTAPAGSGREPTTRFIPTAAPTPGTPVKRQASYMGDLHSAAGGRGY